VLREAGLVHVRDEGRQRLYRLNPDPLKPLHDWLSRYDFAPDVLTPAA
jgi:DNA-binding transcriptional ArsR family regulator